MTSPMATDENPRVIDLWGFLKTLWNERLVWLGVFVVVLVGGGAYAMTRPPVYEATQAVALSLPPVSSTAEAIQQSAGLNETAAVLFSHAALRPPVTDAVLASHPEISSVSELQGRVTALAIGNTIEFQSQGSDPVAEARLLSDITMSFSEQLPILTQESPPALRYVAKAWGDP